MLTVADEFRLTIMLGLRCELKRIRNRGRSTTEEEERRGRVGQ
jgi:hypothetical protein